MKRRLGQFFTVAEMARSSVAERLGLDNTPPPAAQANLEKLFAVVLDPLRALVGREVHIKSGYRSYAVNQAVDGSSTSQHMAGEATDGFAVAESQGRVHPTCALWPARLREPIRTALAAGERRIGRWAESQGVARAYFDDRPVDPFLNINDAQDLANAAALLAAAEPQP